MNATKPVLPAWRQIDAGLWFKTAGRGHVEIAFATANDHTPLFEVTAYDERGRAIGEQEPQAFTSLDDARQFADAVHLRAA